MKRLIVLTSLTGALVSAHAADTVKLGQEAKSAAGVEKIIATTISGADSYWVSTFIRDGNCPEKSGKCVSDAINVRGPGGVEKITLEDATGAAGFFSQTKNLAVAVVVPSNKGGYGYASAELFVFSRDKKPVSALKTEEVLLNNLEGAACEGRKLCAESKLTAVFHASATSEYPDVQLRQSGTSVNKTGDGLEKIEKTFSFIFDEKTRRYIAKR